MSHRIPIAKPDIGQEELRYLTKAVESGWVSSKGPFVDEFERRFSDYVGVKHGIAVSNGTVALHLALTALGIGPGHEVLVPSLTFIAAVNAVTYTGARPVFLDSQPDYWCVDPRVIKENITSRTKAILLVHLYGHPCDMRPILEIARSKNLYVVEDCAEAHGAEYQHRKVGSFGDASCFSFYGNKTITTGEGGMCVTDREELAQKMRILKDHGMNPKRRFWHDIVGFNYRMTSLQAALGLAQFDKIDKLVERKRRIAEIYREHLEQTKNIVLAPEMRWAKSTYWLYSLLLGMRLRDKVIAFLDQEGIETRPFFYPIHILPPYSYGLKLPVAERLSATGLNLPSGPRITDEEIADVTSALNRALSFG